MEEVCVDDAEKLREFGFKEVGRYEFINQGTIRVENKERGRKNTIYAIVVEQRPRCDCYRAKYIGSTIRGSQRRVSLNSGEYKIANLPEKSNTRKIFVELGEGKRAKLYYLTPPKYSYKGLRFETLRDLETVFIDHFKTTKKHGGWNTRTR